MDLVRFELTTSSMPWKRTSWRVRCSASQIAQRWVQSRHSGFILCAVDICTGASAASTATARASAATLGEIQHYLGKNFRASALPHRYTNFSASDTDVPPYSHLNTTTGIRPYRPTTADNGHGLKPTAYFSKKWTNLLECSRELLHVTNALSKRAYSCKFVGQIAIKSITSNAVNAIL